MSSDVINPKNGSGFIQVFSLEMNIKENMKFMKKKTGEILGLDLSDASIWVLSEKQLADNETLQELCRSFDGVVQVQFFITYMEESEERRIDILDVLKSSEESSASKDGNRLASESSKQNFGSAYKKLKKSRWIASTVFKDIQKRYGIPQNPELWSSIDVNRWLTWAKEQFMLENLNPRRLKLAGDKLCNLSVQEFRSLVPNDPDDIFYMHYELLKKMHIVAILHRPLRPIVNDSISEEMHWEDESNNKETEWREELNNSLNQREPGQRPRSKVIDTNTSSETSSECHSSPFLPMEDMDCVDTLETPSSSTDSELIVEPLQHMQLWQFLLKLLTDPNSTDIISWCGKNGEFKFNQPDDVAKLWGKQKGKMNMTYEKLSRALRYYYETDKKIINKVNGQRFVYRFELDLKNTLGYDCLEIQDQINYAKDILSKEN